MINIVTVLITAINVTIKIIVHHQYQVHHYIICITLTFSKIFIANNYVLYAIFLTTKPRFNAKRAYCVIARLGVIAFGKTYISCYSLWQKHEKTEMWYISVHIFCPMRYYILHVHWNSCWLNKWQRIYKWRYMYVGWIRTLNYVCAFCCITNIANFKAVNYKYVKYLKRLILKHIFQGCFKVQYILKSKLALSCITYKTSG